MELTNAVHPGLLLEKTYREIYQEHMLGLPIINLDLAVEALDFVPFNGFWVGILITPWFMNLMLMSRTELCPVLPEGETQSWAFPGGVLNFNGESAAGIGSFQVCSVFSPMGQFTTQEEARSAAQAFLNGLFTEAVTVITKPASVTDVAPLAEMQAVLATPMSKRDFLRGAFLPGKQR